MALMLSLLSALVVFSYGLGGSLGCNLTLNHDVVSNENLLLLKEMGRISPSLCLDDRKDFRFPQQAVNGRQVQKTQAISVLYEMLGQTSRVFLREQSSAAWNTTLLEKLRHRLHRQLEDLKPCVVQEVRQAESAAGKDPTADVKRYFSGIRLYLKQKKYSDCAWEVVRGEIMSLFPSLTSLQEGLRQKDGDLGSP
ncbi:interferon omega-2-like [Rhinolophus ferrumequinum]|uniref:interferon omega-2-like n=1 Tax=Rhinolophus ferrumequinum TaxID=59479 RepID=UPI00140FCA6E|nr:interferon omega-2-like [Rhinolophus ferrumequinum]